MGPDGWLELVTDLQRGTDEDTCAQLNEAARAFVYSGEELRARVAREGVDVNRWWKLFTRVGVVALIVGVVIATGWCGDCCSWESVQSLYRWVLSSQEAC